MKFNTLTSDQQKALKMLNKEKICILKGYSGSGKSYLINHFQKQNKRKHIVLTAPTHKAVSILNGDYTIHAYLGLVLQWYEDKQILISKAHSAKVQKNDILIIDEVSMLNTEILDHIDRAIEQYNLKVIFVGDPCFAKGTEILMYDGNIKTIENINIGDLVMGLDSKPRKVMNKCNGISQLYNVNQRGGMTYTVTGNHKIAYARRNYKKTNGFLDDLSEDNNKRGIHRRQYANEVDDLYRYPSYGDYPLILAEDAINLSDKFSESFGGYKVCVDFKERLISIDPYYLGLWLGDGDKSTTRISTADIEVIDFCKEYANKFDSLQCHIKWHNDKNYYRVSITNGLNNGRTKNLLLNEFRKYKLINVAGDKNTKELKHIPEDFILNSKENRLKLLAGLLDSDGNYTKISSRYNFTNTNMKLINDVERLINSLGLRCHRSLVKSSKCFFNDKEYNAKPFVKLIITGDIHNIPCLIKRKIATKPKKNANITKLTITKANIDEYYGIEVDVDNLFLLKDSTVVSNCQIPPVNESISPIWKRKYPSFTLTEIVRQAKDNPIIQMSYDIRQGKMNTFQSYINPPKIMMGSLQEMKKFYLEHYDSTTILSYRNSIVDKANFWARNLIKNNPKDKFLIGEKVYIRSVSKDQIHKLEDIATIVDVSEPVTYPPYDFNIQRIIIESEKGTEIMLIPYDEKDIAKINKNKKKLVDMAKKNEIKWEEYYNFVESFGDLKLIMAMTVHRSQGSTFQNVIVNIDDIKDRNMLYTAITRVSDKVFLFTHK